MRPNTTLTCAVWHFYRLLSPFLLPFLSLLRFLFFPLLHSLSFSFSLFYTPSPLPHLHSLSSPSSTLPLPSLFSTLFSSSFFTLSSPPPSNSRTPQSPQVGTTVTKKARNSPATTEPTSIPVPVARTALSGTKRLRSVSLEKLPASLTAKRPSRTPTQDSTPVEHPPTLRTGGNEGTFRDYGRALDPYGLDNIITVLMLRQRLH